jgi:hypothetical protein
MCFMRLPYRGQYKVSLYSIEVLQGNKNDSRLIKILDKSLHNPIAITRSPLRVVAMGNGGGCHDDDIVQSAFQIRDVLPSMR